jgi:hypothetical protein
MTRFIYASQLKLNFKVFGSYYDLSENRSEIIKCRNILEIYRRDYIAGIGEPVPIFFGNPDSVFVMMNPGSSEPREVGFREPVFELSKAEKLIIGNSLVKAKPDVTQYQVMRVMVEMGWNHVRVVNLSDIREPKSLKFVKKVKKFEERYNDIHTIFSPLRRGEVMRAFLMKSGDSPVVLGWGMSKDLKPLAEKAMIFLKDFNITGIRSDPNDLQYSHPSPNIQTAKIKWLDNILLKLKKKY